MNDKIFERCSEIANLLRKGGIAVEEGREKLIYLLAYLKDNGIAQDALVCSLAAECGLYPYITPETASWSDCLTMDACSVDVGNLQMAVLHRGQTSVLSKLLAGESIILSAPTSFGKSFIIDAYIAIKKPQNVMIIVPTVALMDETRRRLKQKFGAIYNIITMPGEEIEDKNIFVFPQERVFSYLETLPLLDMLIVDEAYKASSMRKDDRTSVLQNAILKLNKIAKQRYFLMPCVDSLEMKTPLLEGMQFLRADFSPVALAVHNVYKNRHRKEKISEFKKNQLTKILGNYEKKTLIYAGIISEIKKVADIITESTPIRDNSLLNLFIEWLSDNYSENFYLRELAKRRTGIHSGKIHRFLCQLQIKLFAEDEGLNNLISTSSIIEGVNTSAENVVLWARLNGGGIIDYFTYRNIAGRGGRMFKYFVGNVYNLVEPPQKREEALNLNILDDYVETICPEPDSYDLTREQIIKIKAFNDEVDNLVGEKGAYGRLIKNNPAITLSPKDFIEIVKKMQGSDNWTILQELNDEHPYNWELKPLKKLVGYFWNKVPDQECKLFVDYIFTARYGWERGLKKTILELKEKNIDEYLYFYFEKFLSNDLVTLIRNHNIAYNLTHSEAHCKLDILMARFSSAFLPPLVFSLEEMGLPRGLSRRIHEAGLIDLERTDISMNKLLEEMQSIGMEEIIDTLKCKNTFDAYILKNFFKGI